jgi:hypothetical protein
MAIRSTSCPHIGSVRVDVTAEGQLQVEALPDPHQTAEEGMRMELDVLRWLRTASNSEIDKRCEVIEGKRR